MDTQAEAYYRRKPTQERSIRRVAQVLDATRAGILSRGYDGLTMNEIAERAGMQRSAIYRYFSGKPAIMVSLIEAHHADIHSLVEKLFEGVVDRDELKTAVEQLVHEYFQLFLDDPVLPAVWMGAQSAPELSELCIRENERAGSAIARAMQTAGLPDRSDQLPKAMLLLELIGAAARLTLQRAENPTRDQVEAVAKSAVVAVAFS